MKVLIVGTGFTGAVIARKLAESGMQITIIDQRSHIAGNCYTERDLKTGVMEHVYGPHIFHTDDKEVWDFVNQHGELIPFINRVKSIFSNKVYSLPVNLHTINQFYDKALSPAQAKEFIRNIGKSDIIEPENFEPASFVFETRTRFSLTPEQLFALNEHKLKAIHEFITDSRGQEPHYG